MVPGANVEKKLKTRFVSVPNTEHSGKGSFI
jgi:hypothetical protein